MKEKNDVSLKEENPQWELHFPYQNLKKILIPKFQEVEENSKFKKLPKLQIRGGYLNVDNAHILSNFLKKDAFISLKFKNCFFIKGSLEILSEALRINTSLTELSMNCCDLKDQDAEILSDILKINVTLKSLILSDNEITSRGASYLLESFKFNTTLDNLVLGKYYCPFGSDNPYAPPNQTKLLQIENYLQRNQSLTLAKDFFRPCSAFFKLIGFSLKDYFMKIFHESCLNSEEFTNSLIFKTLLNIPFEKLSASTRKNHYKSIVYLFGNFQRSLKEDDFLKISLSALLNNHSKNPDKNYFCDLSMNREQSNKLTKIPHLLIWSENSLKKMCRKLKILFINPVFHEFEKDPCEKNYTRAIKKIRQLVKSENPDYPDEIVDKVMVTLGEKGEDLLDDQFKDRLNLLATTSFIPLYKKHQKETIHRALIITKVCQAIGWIETLNDEFLNSKFENIQNDYKLAHEACLRLLGEEVIEIDRLFDIYMTSLSPQHLAVYTITHIISNEIYWKSKGCDFFGSTGKLQQSIKSMIKICEKFSKHEEKDYKMLLTYLQDIAGECFKKGGKHCSKILFSFFKQVFELDLNDPEIEPLFQIQQTIQKETSTWMLLL